MWLHLAAWIAFGTPAVRRDVCAARRLAGPVISLEVRDADLANTFRLLAAAARVNIVVADDVRGTLTLSVKDAPWQQVLCTIVGLKQLEAVRDGAIYLVSVRSTR